MRCVLPVLISIHALLAESDRLNAAGAFSIKHFYPRSPCGERLGLLSPTDPRQTISIHALLAESDYCHAAGGGKDDDFYPRSPCGERLVQRGPGPHQGRHFYPRSPCGERLRDALQDLRRVPISIHALLAESDQQKCRDGKAHINFYPRSPCGERHQPQKRHLPAGYFYPRSPCGERLTAPLTNNVQPHFYPRSPCGERPTLPRKAVTTRGFLSTLSLRRATTYTRTQSASRVISIHALLAESDDFRCPIKRAIANFYPRSPCGERRQPHFRNSCRLVISIHALLAESDLPAR